MNYDFEYDFIRDYQRPNKMMVFANAFGGISLLSYGITQIFTYFKSDNVFHLSIGIIALLGGLSFLLFAFNGNKPPMKKGQYYLKIANQKMYAKLGRHAFQKEVNLNEIRKIDVGDDAIVLSLNKGEEIWIDIHKIQNERKKQAFIEIMNDWGSRSSLR